MTLDRASFKTYAPLTCADHAGAIRRIPASVVCDVTVASNVYLNELGALFRDLENQIFDTLGQRNLSGFVGEVFSKVFARHVTGFRTNPHPDGRPDLVDVSSSAARAAYDEGTRELANGEILATRRLFNPFRFGGLEVKSSIGSPASNYKRLLHRDFGREQFAVGMPRVDYLREITYWGHHGSCSSLLGLYYDYADALGGAPQIMAVMHSDLVPALDWAPLSIGKPGSKKTSNTALTKSGRAKIHNGLILLRDDARYREALRAVGIATG